MKEIKINIREIIGEGGEIMEYELLLDDDLTEWVDIEIKEAKSIEKE